jgi:hypothetical protein
MEQLSLEAAHQSQLICDRGLGEFLDFIGFRSWQEVEVKNVSADLPGVVEREGSFYLYGQPGLFPTNLQRIKANYCFPVAPR